MSTSNDWENWIINGGPMPVLDLPELDLPDVFTDTLLVVNRETGCHWLGMQLFHSETCMCGDTE